jgi:hypothetical protein
MAFAPGCPGTEMPYSVSMPITRRTLITDRLVRCGKRTYGQRSAARPCRQAGQPDQRYWPVFATVSIERPASLPLLPETSVLM